MVKLYIGISLDGYIADSAGAVGWLEAAGEGLPGLQSHYETFLDSVEVVLLGRATYDQILTFGPWPYAAKQGFVATHRPLEKAAPAHAVRGSAVEIMAQIREHTQGAIWLVGGGELVAEFCRHNLIDEYQIAVAPLLLGAGLPLFPAGFAPLNLQLRAVERLAGDFALLTYRPNNSATA